MIVRGGFGYSRDMLDAAYCPHCRSLLRSAAPYPYPSGPTRCRSCLLLVSAGRATTAAGERRIPRALEAARRVVPGSRPGPVPSEPGVDMVLAVLREVDGSHTPP